QRDVAEDVDVGGARHAQRAIVGRARDADPRAQREGDQPRQHGDQDGLAEAADDPAEIGLLEQDGPIPIVAAHSPSPMALSPVPAEADQSGSAISWKFSLNRSLMG